MNDSDLERYSRHIIIPQIDISGQIKLKKSSVLVAGCGGISSTLLMYLASSGMGEIGIIDHDTVELSNLQRQILYAQSDIGKPKIEATKSKLHSLNSGPTITTHNFKISSANTKVQQIAQNYDYIIDGTDSFESRQTLNSIAYTLKKPFFTGSAIAFTGHTYSFNGAPCYNCLFSNITENTTCANSGILAPLTGVVGSLIACNIIKHIATNDNSIFGQFVLIDILKNHFSTKQILPDNQCKICSST